MKYNIPPDAKCGVYIIRSLTTNDFYIGSSVSFKARHTQHKSTTVNYNTKFGKFLKEKGCEKFSMELLEECMESDRLNRETFFIKKLKPTLNSSDCAPGGGRPYDFAWWFHDYESRIIALLLCNQMCINP